MAQKHAVWILIICILSLFCRESFCKRISDDVLAKSQEKLDDLIEKSSTAKKKGLIEIAGSDFEVKSLHNRHIIKQPPIAIIEINRNL